MEYYIVLSSETFVLKISLSLLENLNYSENINAADKLTAKRSRLF